MGKVKDVAINILIGTESRNWWVVRHGRGIGDWAYDVRTMNGAWITHRSSGRRYDGMSFTPEQAEVVVRALDHAFPRGTFPLNGKGIADPQFRWVFEAVVAAALAGDYVFARRSR